MKKEKGRSPSPGCALKNRPWLGGSGGRDQEKQVMQ